ncbi:carbonic anhydrase family protein [Persephonella atlantica]|uniref:Carbonic anhydrase n=1 Tax=Persephonella atlantica TaxID=2699429 RepID=A0ABS1GEW4_9AQUI|nr:carbonic anhydrase family protein [Persephonella atlantica]MBK3331479.1 carbonic anhydrase family protein [Persephonella atlantica]
MKKLAATLLVCSFAVAGGAGHWSYHGETGPQHWGDLKSEYIMCKIGKNQSPVDLSRIVEADLKKLQINYSSGGNSVTNNGHTIKVSYEPGSYIVVDGIRFELKQFHFHAPSEHKVKGKSYPFEAHFVHADKDGNLAVIGVLFKEGKKNPVIEKIWKNLPETGKTVKLAHKVNAYDLLPEEKKYYRYSGSLTTPPCSEGVRWIVMKEEMELSKEQIQKFRELMGGDTNRPVQPLNARMILEMD